MRYGEFGDAKCAYTLCHDSKARFLWNKKEDENLDEVWGVGYDKRRLWMQSADALCCDLRRAFLWNKNEDQNLAIV